jgi:hypothetical protein
MIVSHVCDDHLGRCNIWAPDKVTSLAPYRNRNFTFFISLSNPRFTRKTITAFCEMVHAFDGKGTISIFDFPQCFNATARARTLSELQSLTLGLQKQSADLHRMCEGIVDRFDCVRISMFEEIERAPSRELVLQVLSAYERCPRFRSLCTQEFPQLSWSSSLSPGRRAIALNYAIFELPILLHYGFIQDAIDVYPGKPSSVVVALQDGMFDAELPHIAERRIHGSSFSAIELL